MFIQMQRSIYPGDTRQVFFGVSKLFLGCVILKRGSDESLMRLCSSQEEDNTKVKYTFKFELHKGQKVDF